MSLPQRCLLSFLCAVSSAFAVDGVVLIDQARAMAGNVTPGDTPGFPITITQKGSYRLSGNLSVSDANTTAMEIRSDFVTIDMNGFSITGPADCSSRPCTPRGTGRGIQAGDEPSRRSYFNIVIRNGTIQGMGATGIDIYGDAITIEDMTLRANAETGLACYRSGNQRSVRVRNNHILLNGWHGALVENGVVVGNTASSNGNIGLWVLGGIVLQNLSDSNVGVGIALGSNTGAGENVSKGNGVNDMSGGVPLGKNYCKDNSC